VRLTRALGYDEAAFKTALTCVIAGGAVCGHWVDIAFYHPANIWQRPLSLVNVFDGQSSVGGFAGAVAGGWLWSRFDAGRTGFRFFFRRRPLAFPLMPFSEIMSATFPICWALSRLGCALVHDHPGRLAPAGSMFALAWPIGPSDGVERVFGPLHVVFGSTSRYDLGLLEAGVTIVIALSFAATWRYRLPMGSYSALLCILYAPARFCLDFLRVTDLPEADIRYGHLTFAQWFCIARFVGGVVLFARMRRGKLTVDSEAMALLMAQPNPPVRPSR
jgi:phosphatidylglycerol:prolipoprotein diacylglycerol transferase